jgi:hypothetical protein
MAGGYMITICRTSRELCHGVKIKHPITTRGLIDAWHEVMAGYAGEQARTTSEL